MSDADLLGIYQALGNDQAVFNGSGVSVTGVYSDKYSTVTALGELIEDMQPNFICRTSDITGATNGQTVVINSVTYYIKTLEPDGLGQTTVMLHK